jgi:hypothetical protein
VKPGDLVLFTWPGQQSRVDDPMSWEDARIGMIIGISASRPDDKIGDELLVMHEGERWSIPSAWCRLINNPAHASGSTPVTMDS